MSGGIKSLNLTILGDKKVYYPGEIIHGICSVVIEDKDRDVPGVIISCRGKVKTHWSEYHRKRIRSYSEEHDLLEMKTAYTPNNYGPFRPGSHHQLPFAFRLPVNAFFTSLEYSSGYIRYWIEADSVVEGFIFDNDIKVKLPFKTLQLIDTNLYQFPIRGSDEKTVCCCCCASGNLSIEASTDRAAYCPNEVVTISATFRNNSNKMVKPYVKLKEKLRFEAEGNTTTPFNDYKLEPVNDDGLREVITEGGFTTWNGMQFRVPEITPSVDCGIIKLRYEIKVGLDIPWALDLEVYLPIVIGTIPFRGGSNINVPRPIMSAPNRAIVQPGQWVGHGRRASRSQRVEPTAPPLLAPPASYNLVNSPPPSYFDTVLHSQQPLLEGDDWTSNRAADPGRHEMPATPTWNNNLPYPVGSQQPSSMPPYQSTSNYETTRQRNYEQQGDQMPYMKESRL